LFNMISIYFVFCKIVSWNPNKFVFTVFLKSLLFFLWVGVMRNLISWDFIWSTEKLGHEFSLDQIRWDSLLILTRDSQLISRWGSQLILRWDQLIWFKWESHVRNSHLTDLSWFFLTEISWDFFVRVGCQSQLANIKFLYRTYFLYRT